MPPEQPTSSATSLLASTQNLKQATVSIEDLRGRIHREVAAHRHLADIQDFNHAHLKIAMEQFGESVAGARLLDVGGSVHGYALESADRLGVGNYIGIDLGVARHWDAPLVSVTSGNRTHLLCQMDAHRLWLDDESIDVAVCLSGFEHYLFPELVLSEICRVLRKGGLALIAYEPIWTCSYGHHLHHFGVNHSHVPPWSHLILNRTQFSELLARRPWPDGCPVSREQATHWVYGGREINRCDVRVHEKLFRELKCSQVLWRLENMDTDPLALASADYAAALLPYSRKELLTRGFSCCFRK